MNIIYGDMSLFCREKKFRGKDLQSLTFYRREFEIVKRRFNSFQKGDDGSKTRVREFFLFMDHETRNNIIDTKALYKVKIKD